MAHRVLGIDIGQTEIKAVLVEASWRTYAVLGAYLEPVPSAEEVAHRLPPAAPEPAPATEKATEPPAETAPENEPVAPAGEETPPPWVFALADLLKKHQLEFNEVTCSLPGTRATTRILTLPFENRRRIEQILPFELENQVPFDLDEMHLSFEVLGKDPDGGFRVLVALTPKPEVAMFLRHVSQAGVDPRLLDLSPYGLFAAARQALPQEMGAYAVLDLGSNHADVVIMNEGQLADLRSIPVGGEVFDRAVAETLRLDPVRAEAVKREKASLNANDVLGQALRGAAVPFFIRLRQTLQGIRSEKGIVVTRLYLTGRGGFLDGLAAALAEELAVEVDWLAPFPAETPAFAGPPDRLQQARFGRALALASRGYDPLRKVALNLRHGPFIYRRQQLAIKSSLRSIAIIGGIIVLLLAYNIIAGHMQKRRQLQQVQDQIVQLYMKAFPGGAPPLQPLDQFRSQIGKTMAKYHAVGFFGDDNLRAIEILKGLSELIPPNIVVDIKKFDLTTESLKLEGEVGSFPDVDALEEALKKLPAFKQVKKESSTTVSEKVKFRFLITLQEKKPKTTGGAPAPQGTPKPPAAPAGEAKPS
ncbi:MAG: pilus assembly protein PilM [Myxococcales bacterium]|nr:pilus assembly protein PilM [Myxococcales bacterium]